MIPVKNIYYMLSYAFSILKEDRYKNIEVEEFDNIYDMFSCIIAKGASLLIKRGLGREYKSLVEITSSPHGKIEVSSSMKKKLFVQQKLECQYDEYSSDIKLNQIIKTTISLLLKQDIKKSIKKELKVIMIYFKDVSLIDYRNISWNFCFNRNNKHYELLVTICFLVIKGFIQTTKNGPNKLMDFIDEQRMCKLYEKFILEFYKRECSWIKTSSSKINWILDDNIADNLPNMQSDIILEANNNVLIIDAKYYQMNMQEKFDKKSIISSNLYQIFTYVKNKQLEDLGKVVSGMLLYARTTDEIQPNNKYQMSGNNIYIKTLDLNLDFSLIKKQLLDIAELLKSE